MGNSEIEKIESVCSVRDHQLDHVLQNYSLKVIEPLAKTSFMKLRKGQCEIYGQFDENQILNGYGKLKKDGQVVYEGQFVESKRNGYGLEFENGRCIYQGKFLNNLREGEGKTDQYEGQWARGKKSGWGIQTKLFEKYEGYWKADKYHGLGTKFLGSTEKVQCFLAWASVDLLFQNFDLDTQFEVYVGEWRDGFKFGQGIFRSKQLIYHGEWEADFFEGNGCVRYRDGRIIRGEFSKGVLLKATEK